MLHLHCSKGTVIGDCGECFHLDLFGKPTINLEIKGDLNGRWHMAEFILDTGSDLTVIHSEHALTYGLNTTNYDREGVLCTLSGQVKIYLKKAVLIKIANFPVIPITIAFSPFVTIDHLILGRRALLNYFSLVFQGEKFGIFQNNKPGD